MTREEVRQRLAAPFDPATISWRVGATNSEKTKGLALAYLDARDVMNRLDDVMGVFGWQSEHIIIGDRTMCRLSIRDPDTGEWVSRTDGAGDTDVEAEKGAFSASLKRCAVNFGVGRYLYDIDSPWVALEQRGKSYAIAERELGRLRDILRARDRTAAPARPTVAQATSIDGARRYHAPTPTHVPAPPPDHQGRTVNSIRDEATAAIVDAKSIARVNELKDMYEDTLAEIDKIRPAVSNNIRLLAETRIIELAAAASRAKDLTNPRMPEEDEFTAMDHRI